MLFILLCLEKWIVTNFFQDPSVTRSLTVPILVSVTRSDLILAEIKSMVLTGRNVFVWTSVTSQSRDGRTGLSLSLSVSVVRTVGARLSVCYKNLTIMLIVEY